MDGSDHYTHYFRTDYIDRINGEVIFDMALAHLDTLGYSESECLSFHNLYTNTGVCPEDLVESIDLQKARVRFQIPSTWADQISGLTVAFTGAYFKITYDIIEEPTGWDEAPPTALRSYVSVDNVIEWTGPGSGAADDPSWFTSWITLDPPPSPGVRRIVNIRFVCRENWFVGVTPQVTGEAVTLPDP